MEKVLKNYQPLEPKFFKAFMAAATTQNFTSAAQMAHMTQSGVSQHIARLEEQIGLPLFKRIGKRVVLTETGERMVKYINEQVYSADSFLDTLKGQHENLTGLVSYAMPPSCLLSPHFSMLLEKKSEYTGITLDVKLKSSRQVAQMVLEDQIDFGFVTHQTEHPLLHLQFFCQEEYIMAGTKKSGIRDLNSDNILQYPYVFYPGADVYYNAWLKHFCSDRPNVHALSLPASGNINSIEGAITMVSGGLGLGVFPRHCIEDLLDTGFLCEYSTAKPPSLNDIFIVKLLDHIYPKRVEQVINWFMEMK